MPRTETQKRTALSIETKKQICQYKNEHPNCSAKKLIEILRLDVDCSTVTKILKDADRWLTKDTSGDTGQLKKERKETFLKVNDALGEWVTGALLANHVVNGKILQIKAREFAMQFLEESHFKASDGWLESFKKRNNLRHVRLHGEASSAPLTILPEERDRLKEIIGEYNLDDVYNADETALFYRMPPNTTLATGKAFGSKRDKTQITILLACNATGSDKLQPLVIGTAARPQCFRRINMESLPVTYRHNPKAWMRGDIFCEWLDSLNREMRRKDKNILLLIDNAGPHGKTPPNLSNVTIKYLPPNTTSHLQPLDAGIIAAFKAHYRKLFLFHLIDQYDGKIPESKMSLKDAIYFVVDAWDAVTDTTVQNCWRHTKILGDDEEQAQQFDITELQTQVQVLIDQLDVEYAETLSAREYIDLEQNEPAMEFISDSEIVQLVNSKYSGDNANENNDNDDDETPLPRMSSKQGKTALENALRYCEEQDEAIDPAFLAKLRALIRNAALQVQNEKKQLPLSDFFK
jgi:hypothetical protein